MTGSRLNVVRQWVLVVYRPACASIGTTAVQVAYKDMHIRPLRQLQRHIIIHDVRFWDLRNVEDGNIPYTLCFMNRLRVRRGYVHFHTYKYSCI
jgi:hypothetical protein